MIENTVNRFISLLIRDKTVIKKNLTDFSWILSAKKKYFCWMHKQNYNAHYNQVAFSNIVYTIKLYPLGNIVTTPVLKKKKGRKYAGSGLKVRILLSPQKNVVKPANRKIRRLFSFMLVFIFFNRTKFLWQNRGTFNLELPPFLPLKTKMNFTDLASV